MQHEFQLNKNSVKSNNNCYHYWKAIIAKDNNEKSIAPNYTILKTHTNDTNKQFSIEKNTSLQNNNENLFWRIKIYIVSNYWQNKKI